MKAASLIVSSMPCLSLCLLVGIDFEVAVVWRRMIGGDGARGSCAGVEMCARMIFVGLVDLFQGGLVSRYLVLIVHVGEDVQILPCLGIGKLVILDTALEGILDRFGFLAPRGSQLSFGGIGALLGFGGSG